ncbi:MAG TPA: hypothetical protein VL171_13605 [Verrucomicrobiae bacterium]|nr:hypothetical protein [Verrucomicrobiae bacterium]
MTSKIKALGGAILAILGAIRYRVEIADAIWDIEQKIAELVAQPWFRVWGCPIIALLLLITLVLVFFFMLQKLKALRSEMPITIALFLPLDNAGPDAKKDGESQLRGVVDLLKKDNELTRRIHLKFFDSALPRHTADRINEDERKVERIKNVMENIKKEYKTGTRYFFCTMSQVCESLVPEFVEWSNKIPEKKPQLVCSVTASPITNLTADCAFRYYPHSEDEVIKLVEWMRGNSIQNVFSFGVKSAFGIHTHSQLNAKCNGHPMVSIMEELVGRESIQEIQHICQDYIDAHGAAANTSCIFLVLYGESLSKTIDALNTIQSPLNILSVSTLTTEIAAKHTLGKQHKWVTCVPEIKGDHPIDNDIISYFVYASLRRYARVIVESKNNTNMKFSDLWSNNMKFPPGEMMIWQNNCDSKITMKTQVISV